MTEWIEPEVWVPRELARAAKMNVIRNNLIWLKEVLEGHKAALPLDHPNGSVTPPKLDVLNPPEDGRLLAYDGPSGKFRWDPLPSKFPFWSYIIPQTGAMVGVPAHSSWTLVVRPPAGEVWQLFIDLTLKISEYQSYVCIWMYEPVAGWVEAAMCMVGGTYGWLFPSRSAVRLITRDNPVLLHAYNSSDLYANAVYCYSGFSLSQPLWAPQRKTESREKKEVWPWRKWGEKLPKELEGLEGYAYEVWDPLRRTYVPAVRLEEDVIATDPETGAHVEVASKWIAVQDLLALLPKIRADPEGTGFSQYLELWKQLGVKI